MRYKEDFYSERDETLTYGRCPILGNTQGQVRQGFKQPDLVEVVLTHSRVYYYLHRFLWTLTILWLYNSKCTCNITCAWIKKKIKFSQNFRLRKRWGFVCTSPSISYKPKLLSQYLASRCYKYSHPMVFRHQMKSEEADLDCSNFIPLRICSWLYSGTYLNSLFPVTTLTSASKS